jgi:DMSO/TMAO reductase YedYZ molybdopterin-dependent catalytic subunit
MRFRFLASLFLVLSATVSAAAAEPKKAPDSIALSGAVDHPRDLKLADLAKEPATTEAIFLHTGHGVVTGDFTGALLWTLLSEAGVKLDPNIKNDVVRHTVTITGADGYSATLSLGEIAPEFGGEQAIIAYQVDGKPIENGGGFARLIVPGDKGAGRAVSAVTSIEVR